MTKGSAYTLDTARQIESILTRFVQPNAPYALLDWPNYDNVGDSAIWLGARQILEKLAGRPPSFVSRGATYPSHLAHVMPAGTIFLLGGGNFGDIYTNYQKNRHRIFRQLGHRKIVQLPQSLHFSNPEAISVTAEAIARHPDFTLLVRDLESLELAREKFECCSEICPDLAFSMGPITSQQTPRTEVLCLMRDDVEQLDHGDILSMISQIGIVGDWNAGRKPLRSGLAYSFSRRSAIWSDLAMPWIKRRFDRIAQNRLDNGLSQLARGQITISDRLHGHILSTMLGKQHLVSDNSYGKIARYRRAWPGDDLATIAENGPDALDKARSLLVVQDLRQHPG